MEPLPQSRLIHRYFELADRITYRYCSPPKKPYRAKRVFIKIDPTIAVWRLYLDIYYEGCFLKQRKYYGTNLQGALWGVDTLL